MLKTLARKGGTCETIRRYLERDGRAVTFDCSYDVTRDTWAAVFDRTRDNWEANDGRSYYHFIVSPDPHDGLDVDAVRELATSWVRSTHPDCQWIVETHVDNGIPHAHIVANSVLPETGRKMHFSNATVASDAAELQRLCLERGYSAFDNFDIVANEEGEWVARSRLPKRDFESNARKSREVARARRTTQNWMRQKGVHLWTDDMRDAIEGALRDCCTWQAFERELAKAGYEARVSRRGVLTFYPPKGEGHPTKGYKLDDSYTVDGIRARLRPNLGKRLLAGVVRHGAPAREVIVPRDFAEATYASAKRHPSDDSGVATLRGVLDALAVVRENGYTSYAQLAGAVDRLEEEAHALSEELERARIEYEHMEEAARAIIQREALVGRVGKKPRRPLSERGWRKANAEELERIEDIDKWLEEHGLSAEASLCDVQTLRDGLYRNVTSIATRAAEASKMAERISNAARAVGAVPGVLRGGRSTRSSEARAPASPRLRAVMTAEQWTEYVRTELKGNRQRARRIAELCIGRTEEPMPLAVNAKTIGGERAHERDAKRAALERGASIRDERQARAADAREMTRAQEAQELTRSRGARL